MLAEAIAEPHQKLDTDTGSFSALLSLAPFLPTECLADLFVEEAAQAADDGADVPDPRVAQRKGDQPS